MSFRLISQSTFSLLIVSSLLLSGCGKYSGFLPKFDSVVPDQRKEYKKSESLPDLEVPPDLTSDTIDDSLSVPDVDETGSATFSTYQERVSRQKENRLYSNSGDAASIAELSGEQLIVVNGSTADVWISLQDFWSDLGFSMDLDDQELGIMETNWNGDEDSQKRDKFKIFVEPAEEVGTTSVYLSHLGENFDQGLWEERDRDLSLERKMAVRMQSALGGASPTTSIATATYDDSEESEAFDTINSELINAGDGKMYLAVQGDVDTIWSLVGEILDSDSNIIVEEKDSAKGTYNIAYIGKQEKKGLMSKLAFWKDNNTEFTISLTEVGAKTEVIVLDEDGKWDSSATADLILNMINSAL